MEKSWRVGMKKSKRDWEQKNDKGCDSEVDKRCERFIDYMWNCKMLMLSKHFLSQPVISNIRFYLTVPFQGNLSPSLPLKKNRLLLPIISPVCSREIPCILVHIYGHHDVSIYGSGIWMQEQQSPKCKWISWWKSNLLHLNLEL